MDGGSRRFTEVHGEAEKPVRTPKETGYEGYEDKKGSSEDKKGLPENKDDKQKRLDNKNDDEDTGELPDEETNPLQAMHDSDAENYGTDDFDAQAYDTEERELSKQNQPEISQEQQIKEHQDRLEEARRASEEEGIIDEDKAMWEDQAAYHEQELARLQGNKQENPEKLKQQENAGKKPEQMKEAPQKQKLKAKKDHGIKRGLKDVAMRGYRGAAKKVGITPGKGFVRNSLSVGKKLAIAGAKGYAGLTLGATAAILAGSAAIVAGDPKAALGGMVGGAVAGSKIGSGAINKLTGKNLGVMDTFNRGRLGDKYQEKKNEQEDNIWAKSQKTAEAYSSFQDPKAAIQAAKEIRQKTGETDDKKIKDALKMTKEFGSGNLTFNEAKGLPLLSQQIPDEIYSDNKKYAQMKEKIQKRFVIENNMNESVASEQAEKILRNVGKYKGKLVPTEASTAKANEEKQRLNSAPTSKPKPGKNVKRVPDKKTTNKEGRHNKRV